MSRPVTVDAAGGVAVVTLDRPEVRNALNGEVLAALADAVLALDRDEGIAAVVLTGADPAFCAGFDLRQLSQRPAGGPGPAAGPPP
ncbi:MAG: enoyl-CoA hydratase-related protein, partial [Acidimicrobiales bacterium]